MSDILRCPFCGGSARVSTVFFHVLCNKHPDCIVGPHGESAEEAIALWNSRPAPAVVSVRMPQRLAFVAMCGEVPVLENDAEGSFLHTSEVLEALRKAGVVVEGEG